MDNSNDIEYISLQNKTFFYNYALSIYSIMNKIKYDDINNVLINKNIEIIDINNIDITYNYKYFTIIVSNSKNLYGLTFYYNTYYDVKFVKIIINGNLVIYYLNKFNLNKNIIIYKNINNPNGIMKLVYPVEFILYKYNVLKKNRIYLKKNRIYIKKISRYYLDKNSINNKIKLILL